MSPAGIAQICRKTDNLGIAMIGLHIMANQAVGTEGRRDENDALHMLPQIRIQLTQHFKISIRCYRHNQRIPFTCGSLISME
ncbi:hypothetical protein D3C77_556410 [compost metagenome]